MFVRITAHIAAGCALLVFALLFVPSAQAQPANPSAAIPLNLDEFAANLDKEFKNKCVGYGFVIFQDGWPVRKSKPVGHARVASDAPETHFNSETRIDINSCSKLVSAIAVLRELETRGDVSLQSKIYKYLPSNWKIHASVKEISFQEMLAHKSGLVDGSGGSRTPGKVYDYVKAALKKDVSQADKTKASYQNVNYSLCRVVVSYLVNPAGMKTLENDIEAFERTAAECFIERSRKHVILPAGLSPKMDATTWDKSVPETLCYDFKNPTGGLANKDSTLIIGGGGWYMNARELAQICSALDRGKLLTKSTYAKQKAESLGMFQVQGQFGTYHWHNGAAPNSGHTDFMLFPNGVQVAVVTNSWNNSINAYGGPAYRETIKKAFDDACLLADLKVKSFAANGAAKYQGDYLHVPFKLTVENIGKGGTDIQFINALYLGEEVVWTGFMEPLAAGKSLTVQGTAKIKDKAHKHQGKDLKLKAVADARIVAADTSVPTWGTIRESDENNNAKTATFPVPGGMGGGPGGVKGKKGG